MSLQYTCHINPILQLPKDRVDVIWDLAMTSESRFMAVSTELEILRKEISEFKRVDEFRCANAIQQ